MASALVAVAIGLITTAIPAQAQTSDDPLPSRSLPLDPPPGPPAIPRPTLTPSELADRRAALREWTREFTEWTEWHDRWHDRPEPGWFGNRPRRQKPDPPSWLFDECLDRADLEAPLMDACRLLDSWKEIAAPAPRGAPISSARTPREDRNKTTFWNHVHADALWITPSSTTSYGVIGVHVTLKLAGRWQIFAAPGAILLSMPTSRGTRTWQPATDLGFSYRLFDLTLPGGRRQGTVHLNVARAWIIGGSTSAISSSLDLAGLSLTFK